MTPTSEPAGPSSASSGKPSKASPKATIIELYSGYDEYMTVRTADNLRVYRDPEASVVVLEYEVHGESVQAGRPYDNQFVSIITVKDGKVIHWRDYLDPIAIFDATGWRRVPGFARRCFPSPLTGRR